MNENAKRLFGRLKNDLRAINHTRKDRVQAKLLADATLALLEFEMLKPEREVATEEKVQ
jgi:hypothetical protein